jgi:hypothetical protein
MGNTKIENSDYRIISGLRSTHAKSNPSSFEIAFSEKKDTLQSSYTDRLHMFELR